jgi:hypothetical protein
MTTTSKDAFVPKELGSLPRILLLDFKDEYVPYLADSGYSAFAGHSGLGPKPFRLPKHESEIEIILWDTSNLQNRKIRMDKQDVVLDSPNGRRLLTQIAERLASYCNRVGGKGGFVGVFLGDSETPATKHLLSDILGTGLSFSRRRTSTMALHRLSDDDPWFELLRRFVSEKNIHYAITVYDPFTAVRYFHDEDNNWYAVKYKHFAVIPKIEPDRKKEAITFLLQDVLPFVCTGDEIFPDKYYYRWENSNDYLPLNVLELKGKNDAIADAADRQISDNKAMIEAEMKELEYLSNLLIADDSDLFPDEKKLSRNVQKVLEDDFGFSVTDVDAMRLEVGESLKEDKWIEDTDGFFALVEIKGTERGARANWVRQDLNAHIKEFEVVQGTSGLRSILIFNHERRTNPANRSAPFSADNDLIEYCKRSNITLVPVYELFKMARDIRASVLSKENARRFLKDCVGLFVYDAACRIEGKKSEPL